MGLAVEGGVVKGVEGSGGSVKNSSTDGREGAEDGEFL